MFLIMMGIIGVLAVLRNTRASEKASAEESFGQYQSLHEGVESIESKYLGESGYVDTDDIAELIEAVSTYVGELPSDMVESFDVGEDYVQVNLTTGLTYVYSPRTEHTLSRGDGLTITVCEQETIEFKDDRDNSIKLFDLRAEPEELGLDVSSLNRAIATYLTRSDSDQFESGNSYADGEVTLDVVKGFGRDELVIWEGHGSWTSGLGSILLLPQEVDHSWWSKLWSDDFWNNRLVMCGDNVAVTSAFFTHHYGDGSLDDTVFYLGSCSSLRDDRLASSLTSKGADLVIGNTNTVSTFYQNEMRDSILSSMADYRIPISEALDDAVAIYGTEDPWCSRDEHTRVSFYPSDAGDVTLYGADKQRLEKESDDIQITNYEFLAGEFVSDWYDDWSFTKGRQERNLNAFPGRCLKRIEGGSPLFGEFVRAAVEDDAAYAKTNETCVIGDPKVEVISSRTFRVSVQYVSASADVDQDQYDRMVKDAAVDVWDVTLNDACKVTALSEVSRATNPGEPDSSKAVARKLITSFHMVLENKKASYIEDEWVKATYDEEGNITYKEMTGDWPRGEHESGYSLNYEYDEDGRLIRVIGDRSDLQQPSGGLRWDITYGPDGDSSHAAGEEYSSRRFLDDMFDDEGHLVSRDYLIRTSQVLSNGSLTLTYDKEGRISSLSADTGYNEVPETMSHYEASTKYDGNNRLTSIETVDSDGKLFSRRTYQYDDAGHMLKRSHFYDGGGSGLTVDQTYTYDGNGRLVSGEQQGNDGYWASSTATFTTDDDGSIISARIESDGFIRTYEVEYVLLETPRGKEPFNAVDLTNPFNPVIYNELWFSAYTALDPTPFDEREFLRANRKWLELNTASSQVENADDDASAGGDSKGLPPAQVLSEEAAAAAAEEFLCVWYDDWTFDGEMVRNEVSLADRCGPLVDPTAPFNPSTPDGQRELTGLYPGPMGRSVACCVLGTSSEPMGNGTYRTTVVYVGVQGLVESQEQFNNMRKTQAHADTWDVTISDDGLVTNLEIIDFGVAAEDPEDGS